MEKVFQVPTLVVLTGAARGIGQATAVAFAKQIQTHGQSQASRLVLLDILDLSSTQEQIQTVSDIPVSVINCDLSELGRYDELTSRVVEVVDPRAYRHAILVNNAATMLYKFPWELQPLEVEKYFRLNVSSMVALSAWFVREFKSETCETLLISLTSTSTRRAVRATVIYAMGKVARDYYIRDMVNDDSSIWAFSYGPGLVDTDMSTAVLENNERDPDLIKRMDMWRSTGQIISPAESADKMVKAIVEKRYTNGGRIDYIDLK